MKRITALLLSVMLRLVQPMEVLNFVIAEWEVGEWIWESESIMENERGTESDNSTENDSSTENMWWEEWEILDHIGDGDVEMWEDMKESEDSEEVLEESVDESEEEVDENGGEDVEIISEEKEEISEEVDEENDDKIDEEIEDKEEEWDEEKEEEEYKEEVKEDENIENKNEEVEESEENEEGITWRGEENESEEGWTEWSLIEVVEEEVELMQEETEQLKEKREEKFEWVEWDEEEWLIIITRGEKGIRIKDKNLWETENEEWIQDKYYQRWKVEWYEYTTSEDVIENWFEMGNGEMNTIETWEDTNVCGVWYHIPTVWEWEDIEDIFVENGNEIGWLYRALRISLWWKIEEEGDRVENNGRDRWYLWTITQEWEDVYYVSINWEWIKVEKWTL